MMTFPGCCEDHGQRPCADTTVRQKVHSNESQHPGSVPENPDPQIKQRHGSGHEGRHEGHDDHESTGELNKAYKYLLHMLHTATLPGLWAIELKPPHIFTWPHSQKEK